MVLWFIVVTTWDFVRMKEEKPRRQKRKEPPASCCVWGRRIGENEGRRYYVVQAVAQNTVTALVGISERRNQPTWPLGATPRFRAEILMLPYPEVSVWH